MNIDECQCRVDYSDNRSRVARSVCRMRRSGCSLPDLAERGLAVYAGAQNVGGSRARTEESKSFVPQRTSNLALAVDGVLAVASCMENVVSVAGQRRVRWMDTVSVTVPS